jgi:hypothetical protein
MRLIGFLFLFLICSQSTFSAEKRTVTIKKPAIENSKYNFILAYGSEYRPERDVENNYSQHYFSNYAAGISKDRISVILEMSAFSEKSGNVTLNLERKFLDYLLWGQYSVYSQNFLNAFVGLAAGAYQESVTTNFLGQSTTNNSKYSLMTAGAIGARANISIFFASLEARLLFGDQLENQPRLAGLMRFGLWF